jgi:oxygen-independent coproporphyrinogen-3 oxidase
MFGTENFPYAEEILAQMSALRKKRTDMEYAIPSKRNLPQPVWVQRGLRDSGPMAWNAVKNEIESEGVEKPFCIYLHVPFCTTHCQFCDCYAFALRKNIDENLSKYCDAMRREINHWASIEKLALRPVSTVHFGGGTPLLLGKQYFPLVLQQLYDSFMITNKTELAIESTSSSLNDESFELLHSFGFRRLHLGVQSLNNAIRQKIGRREDARSVVKKIQKAISLDWIISVDIIVGLPGQTVQGIMSDLNTLIDIGVEGFSIYELQKSNQNRRFCNMHCGFYENVEMRYLLFQIAFQHLLSNGFSMNVFNHLAKGRDKNLYFTFPERNEDLLALGTIADGVFGEYHYRHPTYLSYINQVSEGNPGLQGGIRKNTIERLLHPLEIEIMSGCIDKDIFMEKLGYKRADQLFENWIEKKIIMPAYQDKNYLLTPNGAWFIGKMLEEIQKGD